MISFFRRIMGSRWGAFFALAFVVLIGFAFALGDVTGSSSFGGLGSGHVAKVGDRKIGMGEFQDILDNSLRAERRENPTLDMGKFIESGGMDATLNRLINRYALAIFGEEHGIAVSKRLVDSEIRKLPNVNGADGKFSQPAFEAFLRGLDLTEAMIRDDFTQNLYAQQILPVAGAGAPAPESLVLPYASLLLEKRSGDVALIPAQAFLPSAAPTDAQLQAYYRTNSVRFTIPEKRAISYAMFDASIVDSKADATTQEIAAYYKANPAKYAASQTRDIGQLVFPTQAAANAAVAKIKGGQSLDAVAKELGLSVTNSTGITKEALTGSASKAVADAVFAAPQGGVAAPARGGIGWYVVKVNAVKEVAARPLAAVSAEIAKTISTEKRAELLSDLTGEIEDEFAGGATLADMAKAQGLKVETTPPLFANGQNPASPGYRPIPEMQRILPAAFEMETDGEAQLIEIVPGEKFAMVSVADFEEAAPPPLAEVRGQIAQLWALSEGAKKAKAVAEQVQKSVQAGKSLADAMQTTGVKLPPAQPVSGSRMDLNRPGQQMPPPLAMMFAMKKGTAKTLAAAQNQGWFVVKLNEVIKGDASKETELVAARRQELLGLLQQEYAAQMINAARAEVGVSKNEDALKDIRNRLTNSEAGQ
jgi:peptidyl-prolyl cis-trans isomerase D